MKKRILSIMLILCMALMVVPISVNAMSLNVNLSIIGKENLTLNVESGDSIANVKEKIKTETELPVTDQILKYEGKVLEDGRTLADYNIQKESIIELSLVESIPEGLEYTISDAGEATITGYTGSATTVNIPKQIDGNYVTSIGERAFFNLESLTSITIPNSVTSIGEEAFLICTSIESITIPNSVTSIGEGAFANCLSLTSITIPNSVTSIGKNAFAVTNLTSITIPNSVTSIGEGAFKYCKSLESITIPNSVTSIGERTFFGCTSLESIFMPDGLDDTMAYIPETTTQVRYSVSNGEVTITEIDLGADKSKIDIPDTICGYPVVAVETSEQSKIGAHTHAGGKATCQTEATCGICNTKYGNIGEHSYTKEDKNIEGALKTAGTCQSEAIYYYSCEFCREVEGNDNHTFTGDKAPDKHTGEKVWTKTETQHEQKWNCCEITTVSLENHQWENGVCTECNYICVHADTDTISTNPQTGDNIIMSIIIFALALIGILGIFIINKKKVKNNK